MVDDSGLELSLGLSFGGSSRKSKVKDAISEPKSEGSASKLMGGNMTISDDSLKNFFKSSPENHDPKGKQKSDPIVYRHESFFTDLSKSSSPVADCSNDAHSKSQLAKYQDLWMPSNRTIDPEEKKSGSSKRKLPFDEINFQNKNEKQADYVDKHGGNSTEAPSRRNSHASITLEDGSSCVNKDACGPEAGGLTTWLGLQREEKVKSIETSNLNRKNSLNESSLSGKEPNSDFGKVSFGVPLLPQQLPIMAGPYTVSATVSSTSGEPNTPGIPSTCVMQLMPNVNGERPVVPANSNNMPLALNQPSVQLQAIEKGSSWAFNSQPLHAFSVKKQTAGVQNQEHFEDGVKTFQGPATHNATGVLSYSGKSSELTIGMTKYVGEAPASSQADGSKSRNEATSKPAVESSPSEKPDRRSGIAPYLEFGAHGSYPDLPWVSARGQGPNGKTISGVTYKFNQNEVKVVCACHGIHMSQEEFVRHADGGA
ncbi:hypothetical protein KSP40_PGU004939 [Platanthera guangdongensis]|uniref:Ninja-family protein n=1 Tax=Platanthera guangdongensis TaxID=2320717 RepID=A0ABR2LJN8_9ASPA